MSKYVVNIYTVNERLGGSPGFSAGQQMCHHSLFITWLQGQ